jgi:hypothetical protein
MDSITLTLVYATTLTVVVDSAAVAAIGRYKQIRASTDQVRYIEGSRVVKDGKRDGDVRI